MSKNPDEHYCRVNVSDDSVTDVYAENDRWACKTCGREIIVEATPTSPFVLLLMGIGFGAVLIGFGIWIGHVL